MEYSGVHGDYSRNQFPIEEHFCPPAATVVLLFMGVVGVVYTRDCEDYCPGRNISIGVVICGAITAVVNIVLLARFIFRNYQDRENPNRMLIADVDI